MVFLNGRSIPTLGPHGERIVDDIVSDLFQCA